MAAPKAIHILLVEDEPNTAKVLARMLREDGYRVEVTSDGAVAIGRLTRPPAPDVLIADVRLPHVDGLSIARYARAVDPKIPIMLTTSYASQACTLEREMDPHPRIFAKPYDYKDLAEAIEKSVGACGDPRPR